MKVLLGKTGLNKSRQNPFLETTKCHKCGGEARIIFVGFEEDEMYPLYQQLKRKYICDLRINGGKGDFWPHDVIACAVYLCKECFEPTAILNQS